MTLRNCEFKLSERGDWIKGKFHRWGDDYVYEHDGTFGRTYGIVEDENGIVYQRSPYNIRFTDQPKDSAQ